MSARLTIAAWLLLVACLPAPASAGGVQTAMDKATASAAGAAQKEPRAGDASTAMPDLPSEAVLNDAGTRQKYLDAMQRYYEYRASGYAYRSRVFEWQLFSSRVIFVVVLLLVACGIYFAAVQFRASLGAMRRATGAGAADAPAAIPLGTQLEVSAKGVVINSSVLGVIILGLSLAFFYLYLAYVYPIQNVF